MELGELSAPPIHHARRETLDKVMMGGVHRRSLPPSFGCSDFCRLAVLSFGRSDFCRLAVLSFGRSVLRSFCRSAVLSFSRSVVRPFRRSRCSTQELEHVSSEQL